MARTTRQCPSKAEVWSYLGHHGCVWCREKSLFTSFCVSCWVLWLVLDVAFQNHLPEWLNVGFNQGKGAP